MANLTNAIRLLAALVAAETPAARPLPPAPETSATGLEKLDLVIAMLKEVI